MLSNNILLENSFILKLHIDEDFLNVMNKVVAEIEAEVHWFVRTPLIPHVTVGYSGEKKDASTKLTIEEVDRVQQLVKKDVETLLVEKSKKTLLLLPADISISQKGWVILEVKEVILDSEIDISSLSLKELHCQFVDILQKKEYYQEFKNPKYIRERYTSHVSIGKVKTVNENKIPNPEEINAAIVDFTNHGSKMKEMMLSKCLAQLPVVKLSHHVLINDLNPDKPLLEINIPKRNLKVSNVVKSEDAKQPEIYMQFNTVEDATKCAKFLYTLGAHSKGSILPYTMFNNKISLKISKSDYDFITDMIDNCPK